MLNVNGISDTYNIQYARNDMSTLISVSYFMHFPICHHHMSFKITYKVKSHITNIISLLFCRELHFLCKSASCVILQSSSWENELCKQIVKTFKSYLFVCMTYLGSLFAFAYTHVILQISITAGWFMVLLVITMQKRNWAAMRGQD